MYEISNSELKKRVQIFLKELNLPKSKFCENVHISQPHFYKWLTDERNLSIYFQQTIDNYLSKYGF